MASPEPTFTDSGGAMAPEKSGGLWTRVEVYEDGEGTVQGDISGKQAKGGGNVYRSELLLAAARDLGDHEDVSTGQPSYGCSVSPFGLCLCVDSVAHIFDASAKQLKATVCMDHTVETSCWSPDGSLLVIGDKSGALSFVSLLTLSVLFSDQVTNAQENSMHRPFRDVQFAQFNGDTCLFVLLGDGQLLVFSNLRLGPMGDAIRKGDIAALKQIKEDIQCTCTPTTQAHGIPPTAFSVVGVGSAAFIVTAGNGLCVWVDQDGELSCVDRVCLPSLSPINTCQVLGDGTLLARHEDTSLSLWDPNSLILVQLWERTGIDRLVPLSSNATNRGTETHTGRGGSASARPTPPAFKFAATRNDMGESGFNIMVVTLPQWRETFCMDTQSSAQLASLSVPQDRIFVAEMRGDPSSQDLSVCVRSLTEAEPATLFLHMCDARDYVGAIAYARKNRIDEKEMYSAIAQFLLEDVRGGSGSIEELMKCLDRIQDLVLVVEFCLEADLPTLPLLYQLLPYARTRVEQALGGPEDEEARELQELVESALQRLDSYTLVLGARPYAPQDWHQFRNASMDRMIELCFTRGMVEEGMVLWCRHRYDDGILPMTVGLLQSLPEDIPSRVILRAVSEIAKSIETYEQATDLAAWVLQRAKLLEVTEREHWPQNSLKLSGCLAHVYQRINSHPRQHPPRERALSSMLILAARTGCDEGSKDTNPWADLEHLHSQLQDIENLATNYSLNLSLAQFSRETPGSIVYLMLETVPSADLLPAAITDKVMRFIAHKSLNLDVILLDYVQEIILEVERTGGSRHGLPEDRLLAVLSFIESKEKKADAVVEMMKFAPLPCSQVLEDLFREAQSWSQQGHVSSEWYELRKIRFKYGVKNFNASNPKMISGMVRQIVSHVEVEGCLDDALVVVGAYTHLSRVDVYVWHVLALCAADRLQRVEELMRGLERGLLMDVGTEIVVWVMESLPLLDTDPEDTAEWVCCVSVGIAALRHMLATPATTPTTTDDTPKTPSWLGVAEQQQLLSDLQHILQLYKQTDHRLSIEGYRSEQKRDMLVWEFMRHVLEPQPISTGGTTSKTGQRHNSKKGDGASSQPKDLVTLYLVGELLGIDRRDMMQRLALEYARAGRARDALNVCQDLIGVSTGEGPAERQTADTLVSVAIELNTHALKSRGYNQETCWVVADQMATLLANAVAMAAPADLCDYLELLKTCTLAQTLYRESNAHDTATIRAPSSQAMPKPKPTTSAITFDFLDEPIKPLAPSNVKDTGATTSSNPPTRSIMDRFETSLKQKRFHEDGLVLSSNEVLPLAHEIIAQLLPSDAGLGKDRLPYQPAILGMSEHESEGHNQTLMPIPTGRNRDTTLTTPIKKPAQMLGTFMDIMTRLIDFLRKNGHEGLALTCITQAASIEWSLQDMLSPITGSRGPRRFLAGAKTMQNTRLLADVLMSLSKKALRRQPLDQVMCVGYLGCCEMDVAYACVDVVCQTATPYARLLEVARVGETLSKIHEAYAGLSDYQGSGLGGSYAKIGADAYWWDRLKQLSIEFSEKKFKDCTDGEYYINTILPSILQSPDAGLPAALSFLDTYGIDRTEAVKCHAELVLLSGETNTNGGGPGMEITTNSKETFIQCLQKMPQEVAYNFLIKCYPKISSYDYDRIDFVLGLCTSTAELLESEKEAHRGATRLLAMLRKYTRNASPGPRELQLYEESYREAHSSGLVDKPRAALLDFMFKKHNSKRLPFHLLIRPQEQQVILHSEENPASMALLISLAEALNYDHDIYITEAVNRMMLQRPQPPFKKIQEILKIRHKKYDSRMLKKEIAERYIEGLDQIDASWAAVEAVESEIKQISFTDVHPKHKDRDKIEQEKEQLLRRRSRYMASAQSVTSAYLFKEYNLPYSRRVQELVKSQPSMALVYLFHDLGPQMYDSKDNVLYRLAEEVCERCRLARDSLYKFILQWAITGRDPKASNETDEEYDLRNVKTALYVVQRWQDLKLNVEQLWNWAQDIKEPSPKGMVDPNQDRRIPTAHRLRALKVLQALASAQYLEDHEDVRPQQLMALHMQLSTELMLETLQVGDMADVLHEGNIEGLLWRLYRNHSHDPRALRFIAEESLSHHFYDESLWSLLLQQMQAQTMEDVKFQGSVLCGLASKKHMRLLPDLQAAWGRLLHRIIEHMAEDSSREDVEINQTLWSLVVECPFRLDNLSKLIKRLHSIGRASLACRLALRFLHSPSCGPQVIESLVAGGAASTLLNTAKETQSPITDMVTTHVFEMVSQTGAFSTLGSHLGSYAEAVAQMGDIAPLIRFLLGNNRYQDALQLVCLYHNYHPESQSAALAVESSDPEGVGGLKAYATANGLTDILSWIKSVT